MWRIRDVYPGSRILIFSHPGSRIPDPKTATKERGEKKFVVIAFYVATNFTKLHFSFDVLKKKIRANFQRIIELFTQKIVNKVSKIWIWDPGSEIRDPEKTYFGSRIQESKRHRSRIRIRNTAKTVNSYRKKSSHEMVQPRNATQRGTDTQSTAFVRRG